MVECTCIHVHGSLVNYGVLNKCFFASISDISPSVEGQGWSPEALKHFESLTTDKQLFAVVVSKDLIDTHVYLLDTVSVPGKTLNLGQELAAKGFAKIKAP